MPFDMPLKKEIKSDSCVQLQTDKFHDNILRIDLPSQLGL